MDLAKALMVFFPWAGRLPALDRNAFLLDLAYRVERGAETIAAWQRTAAIHIDPNQPHRLCSPVQVPTEDPMLPPKSKRRRKKLES